MRNKILFVLGMAAFAASLAFFQPTSTVAAQDQLSNDDGCWSGRTSSGEHCLAQTGSKWDDDYLTVTHTNQCTERLYVKVCLQRKDGTWSCSVDGIRPGANKNWSLHKASGRVFANYTGSSKPMQDWVCASNVSDWSYDPG